MQKVSTSLPRDGKYKDLRGVSTTELFTFCPAETPEGQSCGLLQNLSIMAKIRLPIFTHFLQEMIQVCLEDYTPFQSITNNNFTEALDKKNCLMFNLILIFIPISLISFFYIHLMITSNFFSIIY